MKVYILFFRGRYSSIDEPDEILGVFSSRENGEEYLKEAHKKSPHAGYDTGRYWFESYYLDYNITKETTT